MLFVLTASTVMAHDPDQYPKERFPIHRTADYSANSEAALQSWNASLVKPISKGYSSNLTNNINWNNLE